MEKSNKTLRALPGRIKSAKINLTFGAFMNLSVTLLVEEDLDMEKGILVKHSSGRNRELAVRNALELLNASLPKSVEVIDFEVGTYTTPVTRRTYAVAVAVYNVPLERKDLSTLGLVERRKIIERVLREFNYNPRVLNISEVARTFGVSRDSIYYDIEQILKERKKNGSTL